MFQAEDGIRDAQESRGLGDVYKRQILQGAVALRDRDRNPFGYLLSLADVTRLKEVDRLKSDIVANVSHELRTPISALRATLENVVDGVVTPDPPLVRTMLAQTERLQRLVTQLLDLSRLESGGTLLHPMLFPAADLLEAVADESALHSPALTFRVDVAPPAPPGDADDDRLPLLGANGNGKSALVSYISRRFDRAALAAAEGPKGRVQAIVRASFATSSFRREVIGAWLNFYVLAQTLPEARRLLGVYQCRLQSNLVHSLRPLVGLRAEAVARSLGALIDGVYIREALKPATLSPSMSRIGMRTKNQEREAERLRLAREVEAFTAGGGTIEKAEPGRANLPSRSPRAARHIRAPRRGCRSSSPARRTRETRSAERRRASFHRRPPRCDRDSCPAGQW